MCDASWSWSHKCNEQWDVTWKWMNQNSMQKRSHFLSYTEVAWSFVLAMVISGDSVGSMHTQTSSCPCSMNSSHFPKKCLQVAQTRICKTSFQNEHHPSRYMLSQNIMPLLLGYQFCSCWKRGRKSKVTRGVILMGPVMRVDRLRRGGGWALKRCCLQIGFLQVRHPRWVISPSEQPLSYRMICY